MTEFNVTLQKMRFAEVLVDAKDKVEAEKKAMAIYEDGNADWGEDDVEVRDVEEI